VSASVALNLAVCLVACRTWCAAQPAGWPKLSPRHGELAKPAAEIGSGTRVLRMEVRALVRGHTCGLTEKANPDCESLSKVTEQPSKCIMLERESKQTNKKANTHTR
jgi:hypothetical protein